VNADAPGPYAAVRCTGWFFVEYDVPGVVSVVPVSWHAPHATVPFHVGEADEPPHPAFSVAFPP
jgi:hypothetical protein